LRFLLGVNGALAPNPASVQFRRVGAAQPLIVLPVSVNGKGPFSFVLDTGAGISLVTPSVADEAGIVRTSSKEGRGAGGVVRLELGTADAFAVGPAGVTHLTVGVTPELERIAAAVGERIDGALGYDFLRHFELVVDYRCDSLLLASGTETTSERSESPTKFELASANKPLVLVNVFVNECGPFQFAVDTGASTTVLSAELASRLGIAGETLPDVTGGGGRISATAGRVESLRFANKTVVGIDVVVTGVLKSLGDAIGKRLDGIIGYNALTAFRVSIDYRSETLTLEL
jgi:predicted aspartyl protease